MRCDVRCRQERSFGQAALGVQGSWWRSHRNLQPVVVTRSSRRLSAASPGGKVGIHAFIVFRVMEAEINGDGNKTARERKIEEIGFNCAGLAGTQVRVCWPPQGHLCAPIHMQRDSAPMTSGFAG